MNKWQVFIKEVAGKKLFGVFRYIDVNGLVDFEVRGGLWDTEAEAERLAEMLNHDEEVQRC